MIDWADKHVGPGRTFPTETAWARKAGVPIGTLNRFHQTGASSPKTLAKLGKAVGVRATEMLVMGGFLDPEDVDPPTVAELSTEEATAVELLRELQDHAPEAYPPTIAHVLSTLRLALQLAEVAPSHP